MYRVIKKNGQEVKKGSEVSVQEASLVTNAQYEYLKNTFRLAVGLSQSRGSLLDEIPVPLQRLFCRLEESESSHRDQWDNWEHSYSDNYCQGKLWVPECDVWLQQQKEKLRLAGEALTPLWPKNYTFAVCLTHDVDTIGELMTPRQRGRELRRAANASDLSWQKKIAGSCKSFAKILLRESKRIPQTTKTLEVCYGIEKELGVSASYFFTIPPKKLWSQYDCLYTIEDKCHFLGEATTVQGVMCHLAQEGFDVGLHGSYFSAVAPGLLEEQKQSLERAVQAPVVTTRQHWLHFHFPETLILQHQAGFLADTTLGFNRNIGYRAGTGLPFFCFNPTTQRQMDMIEVPLVIQDGALLGENALEYSPLKAMEIVKKRIEQAEATEGCLTFLFHPDIFLRPGTAALYRSIIELCLERNAWITNLCELQKWWRARAERLS